MARFRAEILSIIAFLYFLPNGLTIEVKKEGRKHNELGKAKQSLRKTGVQDNSDDFNCDFESGYCGWINDTTAEFNWTRTFNNTPTKDTGPPWDHTRAGVRGDGYYIFIETSVPRQNGDHARIISPTLQKSGTYCLTFWHHMHGSDVKDLNVYVKGQRSQKWDIISHLSGAWSVENNVQTFAFGQDGDWWNEERVDFETTEPVNIIFEGIRGKNYRGDIALDDISLTPHKCPEKSINCDFENNTCGWTQMSGDEFNWLPNRGGTTTRGTGPLHDHTIGNPDGRYLYIEASWPRIEGDKARLLSPPITCDAGATPVFSFWYSMHGPHIGPLRVYITFNEKELNMTVWEEDGEHGERWLLGQIPIPRRFLNGKPFKVVIEAERKDYRGDTSIDDLSLTGCHEGASNFGDLNSLTTPTTSSPVTTTMKKTTTYSTVVANENTPLDEIQIKERISCDFDQNSMCSWMQATNDQFDWILNQGKTHSDRTGPSSDHTTRKGWYLYAEASSPRKFGDTAMVRSPAIPSPIHSCLKFYYHMRGSHMGTLEVLTARQGANRYNRHWSKRGEQSFNDTDWKYAEVDVHEVFDYELVLRATRGRDFYSDIAIDDITLNTKPCETVPVQDTKRPKTDDVPKEIVAATNHSTGHIVDCAFNRGSICSWKQLSFGKDRVDWMLTYRNKILSKLAGPSSDLTPGSSERYGYLLMPDFRRAGENAILESLEFVIKSPMCFRLWYYMSKTGNLAIYRKATNSRKMIPLWEKGGSGANQWLEARVDIRKVGKMNIYIEAKRGGSGYIAVDDFVMTDGKCETFDCDFEEGMCGWVNDIMQDEFNWTMHNGSTPSQNTGPTSDHTFRNESGNYIYIEATKPRILNEKARVISPVIDPNSNIDRCLTFWYHSFGDHIGAINVYKRSTTHKDAYLGSPLWYNDRNEGDQWLFAKINVQEALPYQIVIEGVRGIDYMGDIAVDDIKFNNGRCDTCCDSSHFKCGNKFCIHKSLRCNKIDDCGDESDESFCDYDPPCGTPFSYPLIREPRVLPTNIQHDVDQSTTLKIPQESDEIDIIVENPVRNKKKTPITGLMKLDDDVIEQLAHPKLGFELSVSGFYSGNVVGSRFKLRKPETIMIHGRRRRNIARRPSGAMRKKRDVDNDNGSVGETFRQFGRNLAEGLHSAGQSILTKISGLTSQEVETKKNDTEQDPVVHDLYLNPVNILELQRIQMEIGKKEKSLTWEERLSSFEYLQQKTRIQSKLGSQHIISDDEWSLMPKARRYMTKSRLRRARRSVKKIAGGRISNKFNYPWQVAYYITDSGTKSHYFCGATLIDRYWIITAAHCPHLGDEHNVVLGDYDLYSDEDTEQECIVEAIFVNDIYRFSDDLVGDIALIQLRYPAKSSKSVQPACLLKPDEPEFLSGHVCVSTGWGRTNADAPGIERYLRHVEMPIISNQDCKATFWSIYTFHDSYVCAGGTGGNSCRGDSGGPLLCQKNGQFYLVGITSWGDTRCKTHIPGVFTRVQSYMKWVEKIRKRNQCN